MVSPTNAWWMTRTKGIYVYSLSPMRQRAFAGFAREMANMVRLHWHGTLFFTTAAAAAYYSIHWASKVQHHNERKDPAFFEREAELALNKVAKAAATEV